MSDYLIPLVIVLIYLMITLIFGIYGKKKTKESAEDYYIASRKIGPVVLFFTIAATNFSAFFYMGFSGAAYRVGYSFYGIMAVGTSVMAINFILIGTRARKLAEHHKVITPPELIAKRYNSPFLQIIFMLVMVFFTIPYIAIQPMGAGYTLEALTNGQIPYILGAIIFTVFIVTYVFLGGMKSVVWTDILQGLLMFSCLFAAVIIFADLSGGLQSSHEIISSENQKMLIRDDIYTPIYWMSFLFLWIVADPMFPQIFQRFFASRDSKSLLLTATLYPIVISVFFLFPIIIGVCGTVIMPGLEGKESDKILPLVLSAYLPLWASSLIMLGAFASFMSTMDSQLLTVSSMTLRDLVEIKKKIKRKFEVFVGRVLVIVIATLALFFAFFASKTFLSILAWAFTGLAVLYPTTYATLFWRRCTKYGCIASIISGELTLIIISLINQYIPDFSFPFQPVVPVVAVATLTLIIASLLSPAQDEKEVSDFFAD